MLGVFSEAPLLGGHITGFSHVFWLLRPAHLPLVSPHLPLITSF